MTIENLDDLFRHTLKDVHCSERKIIKSLAKMERKAKDPKVKAAIASHRDETEEHVVRLEENCDGLGMTARGAKCDAMVGLIEEAEGLMAEIEDDDTMDAALVSLATAIERYEIARYGSLVARAKQLGHPEAAALLKQTQDEEHAAECALSQMAEKRLIAAPAA